MNTQQHVLKTIISVGKLPSWFISVKTMNHTQLSQSELVPSPDLPFSNPKFNASDASFASSTTLNEFNAYGVRIRFFRRTDLHDVQRLFKVCILTGGEYHITSLRVSMSASKLLPYIIPSISHQSLYVHRILTFILKHYSLWKKNTSDITYYRRRSCSCLF